MVEAKQPEKTEKKFERKTNEQIAESLSRKNWADDGDFEADDDKTIGSK